MPSGRGSNRRFSPTRLRASCGPAMPESTARVESIPPWHDIAPRLGFAWSPGGSKNWSIHAGMGIYYNRTEEELALQNLSTPPFSAFGFGAACIGGSPGFASPYQGWCPGTHPQPPAPPRTHSPILRNLALPCNSASTGLYPLAISTLSPHFGGPTSGNYNLTIEQQLGTRPRFPLPMLETWGATWKRTMRSTRRGAPRAIPSPQHWVAPNRIWAVVRRQTFRYNPLTTGLATIAQQATDANSNYNSLQISINKRVSHGLGLLASLYLVAFL